MSDNCYSVIPADQDVEGAPSGAPFNFPPEGGYALFYFTNETFTKVLSALWNGAALTYPTEMYQVIWYFLQNVEAPVDLCEQIAICINDPESPAREAVRDLVLNDPTIKADRTTVAQTPGALTPAQQIESILKPDTCENDYTFNEATVLVDLLDSLSVDIFQVVEEGTNILERASLLVSALPVVGAIVPFDELLQLGEQMFANVQEAYEADFDQVLYDDIRCALWCLFKDDCDMYILRAIRWYGNKTLLSVPDDPVEALKVIIEFILTGSLADDIAVYAMHMLVLCLIQAGQDVIGIDFAQLGIRIVAAGDDPNNDWSALCLECAEDVCHEWYFEAGSGAADGIDGTWPYGPPYGVSPWTFDVGYGPQTGHTRAASVTITFTQPIFITGIGMETSLDLPDPLQPIRWYSQLDGGQEAQMTRVGLSMYANRSVGQELNSVSFLVERPEGYVAPAIIRIVLEYDGIHQEWISGLRC